MNNSSKRYFAGIGSRSAPSDFKVVVEKITPFLIKKNFILRSGGAEGADSFWAESYEKHGGQAEIYLPWLGFNESKSKLLWQQKDWDVAAKFHPNWDNLKLGAKQLMARNTCQLGINADAFSEFVCCWTPEGKGGGGTGQALRLAEFYKIPIFDFGDSKTLDKFRKFCKKMV